MLSGLWDGFNMGSNGSSASYEACIGTTPFGCQMVPFEAAGTDTTSWHAKALELPCGATYYLAVRATNCAGLQHVVASAGAKLCCSGPVGGSMSLVNAVGEAMEYATTSGEAPSIHWSGFSEPCSGMQGYTISLADGDGQLLWSEDVGIDSVLGPARNSTYSSTNNSTQGLVGSTDMQGFNIQLPASVFANLTHGVTYHARVMAMSVAGVVTVKTRDLVIDDTPPNPLSVRDGAGDTDLSCMSMAAPLSCAWTLASDNLTAITRVEWALGSAPFTEDLHNFTAVPTTAVRASRPYRTREVSAGMTIFCTIRSTNAANLTSLSTSDGVKLVDNTSCVAPFSCLPSPWTAPP